jgi:hypothetical protein
MKTYKYKVIGMLLVTVFLMCSLEIKAQSEIEKGKRKAIIENLKTAISSNNTGLRKSGYELCGKLKYEEILPELYKASEKEEDDVLRFVLALTLLEFDTQESNLKAGEILAQNKTIRDISDKITKIDVNQ